MVLMRPDVCATERSSTKRAFSAERRRTKAGAALEEEEDEEEDMVGSRLGGRQSHRAASRSSNPRKKV